MLKVFEKYPIATFLVVVALIFLPNINLLPVSIMEARNFVTAREMLSDGNWWLPTMNGLARYQKPPLPTWITAITGLIFGMKSLFFLRLPVVIMFSFVGVYAYRFSHAYLEKSMSLINALIVVTSFYVIAITIEAPWDIYAHGFMLGAIYHLLRPNRIDKVWAVFFISCSVLSKGPISIYALLVPFLIANTLVNKTTIKTSLNSLGLIILGISIGSLWFLSVRLFDPGEFVRIATKETRNWTTYNVKPIYYYWNFFLQSGLWSIPALVGLVYPYMKTRVNKLKAYQFTFLWTIISVLLLSIIPEKKPRYLMPVLIPLAMNTGFYIQYVRDNYLNKAGKLWKLPILLHFGLLAILSLLFPFIIIYHTDFPNSIFEILTYSIYILLGVSFIVLLRRKKFEQLLYMSIGFFILVVATCISILNHLPVKNEHYNSITQLRKQVEHEGLNVYYLDNISPEMIWEYGSIIPKILPLDNSNLLLKDTVFGVLVNDEKRFESLRLKNRFSIEKRETYDLNLVGVDSKRYKNRLVNHYYLLKSK